MMLSRNNNSSSNGIFVINGQVFSAKDLIKVMQRQGINIQFRRDGLSIDGEYIHPIVVLEGDRCPLAKNCEKRIALIEFLKLQKKEEGIIEIRQENQKRFQKSPISSREFPIKEQHSPESSSIDFIQPNNHDLFEGNISNSQGLFDEPEQQPSRGLFDEPEFTTNDKELTFEDSFFESSSQRHEEFEPSFTRETQRFDGRDFNLQETSQIQNQQLFCKRCGYDLQQNWKVCPSCGKPVEPQSNSHSEDYLF